MADRLQLSSILSSSIERRWLMRSSMAALLFLSPVLWWLGSPFVNAELPVFRDSGHYYFPLFNWIDSEWKQGRLPLWNPLENTGVPVLADSTSSVLYPGKLIFALPLSFPRKYLLYIALHLMLAAGSTWCLARSWRMSRVAATVAAISYAFGGVVLFDHSNVVFLVGAAWLPVGVWAAVKTHSQSSAASGASAWGITSWGVLWSAAMAMMILGGDPQMSYHLMLMIVLYFLAGRLSKTPSSPTSIGKWLGMRRLVIFVAAPLLSLAMAAVQVLPSCEWALHSQRVSSDEARNIYDVLNRVLGFQESSNPEENVFRGLFAAPSADSHQQKVFRYSLGPWRLPELLWPNFSGRLFPENHRWIRILPAEGPVWVPSIYMGVAPFLLAMGAVFVRRGDLPFRWLRWIAILSLVGSWGGFGLVWLLRECFPAFVPAWIGNAVGGLYWFMTVLLPGYDYFRYPSKLLVPFALAMSLLGGMGLDHCCQDPHRFRRWMAIPSGLSLLLACLLFAVQRQAVEFLNRFGISDDWLGPLQSLPAVQELIQTLLHTTSITAIVWLVLRAARKGSALPVGVKWGFVVVTLGDLLIANHWLVPTAPYSLVAQEPALSTVVRKIRDATPDAIHGRAYREMTDHWLPAAWKTESTPTRLSDSLQWDHATFFPKHPLRWNIASMESPLSMTSRDYQLVLDVARTISAGTDGEKDAMPNEVLDLLGVDIRIMPETLLAAEQSGGTLIMDLPQPRPMVVTNATALPRIRIVHRIDVMPPLIDRSNRAASERTRDVLMDGDVFRDFVHTAVVEAARAMPLHFLPSESDRPEKDEVVIRIDEPMRVVIEAHLATDGLLVLGDLYYPGWIAHVRHLSAGSTGGARTVDILRTNRVQRGVGLAAGSYQVEFRYSPRSFQSGAIISIGVWLIVLLGLFFHFLPLQRQNRRGLFATR